MDIIYSIVSGEIIVRKVNDNTISWRGLVMGLPAQEILEIQSSNDAVVLLEWRQATMKHIMNLFRIDPDGNIIWRAGEPPLHGIHEVLEIERNNDVYVHIENSARNLTAVSVSGFLDTIRLSTGEVISSIFVK